MSMGNTVKRDVFSTKFRRTASMAFIYTALIAWSLTTIFPLIWVVNNSFKPSRLILSDSFGLAPSLDLMNYVTAFTRQNIARAYLNSLVISGSTVLLVMALAGLAAYVMTRYKFKLRGFVYGMLTAALLVPAFATIVPAFRLVHSLGLINHPLGVVLPQTAGFLSFAIIVLMGFLSNVPLELEEAAFMEGCTSFQIFFRIIVPIAKPAFATVAIFTFLWSYNDLFLQMIVLRQRESYPISNLLREISSQFGTDFGLMAASVVLVIMPVLIVFLFLQKNIVKGLTAGAIKG